MEVAEDGRTSPSGNLDISRERSNSDPVRQERTIVMNGGNTVPTRRAPTFLNATEVGTPPVAGAYSSPNTPPPVRRSKLAISIGRFFRPWKWRRRKKSQKFITTSQSKKSLISHTVIIWQICLGLSSCVSFAEIDDTLVLFCSHGPALQHEVICVLFDCSLSTVTKQLWRMNAKGSRNLLPVRSICACTSLYCRKSIVRWIFSLLSSFLANIYVCHTLPRLTLKALYHFMCWKWFSVYQYKVYTNPPVTWQLRIENCPKVTLGTLECTEMRKAKAKNARSLVKWQFSHLNDDTRLHTGVVRQILLDLLQF